MDGCSNDFELANGTDPNDPDMDMDGRNDCEELTGDPPTDPTVADSDDGGRTDGDEI